ncbi:GIY-YIG nuclease family protein, partial [Candidatus Saccharibacteria bacterium]|nr:GIY-YIG nuclease family protein [Candidatus Saccharibacteria bacterium]
MVFMGQDKKQWYLYVLKLEKDKYYVGITSQTVKKRFNEHKTGIRAANWTKKYKPVEIVHSRM